MSSNSENSPFFSKYFSFVFSSIVREYAEICCISKLKAISKFFFHFSKLCFGKEYIKSIEILLNPISFASFTDSIACELL